MIFHLFICILHLLRVYYELTMWLAPSWLDSFVGRAVRWYRGGHGFKSRSDLNFQLLIKVVCITAMIKHNFISFSAVQIYDLSYIHLLKFIMLHFIVCLRLFPASLPEERVSEVSHPTASRITFLHAISFPWLLDDSMVLIQSQSCLPSPYAFGYTLWQGRQGSK